ncbi:MAG TPA: hypothetical protein VKQ07_04975 [Jatrophihabitantaceae bacterium]|nr:hypothetical protein [Jatrophihabitantaceae bacterium]
MRRTLLVLVLATVCALSMTALAPDAAFANVEPTAANAQLSYGTGTAADPGVITGRPRVYVVFFGTQWGTSSVDDRGDLTFTNDPNAGAPYLQEFFRGVGTGGEGWSNIMTQYCAAPYIAAGASTCPHASPRPQYPLGGALAGAWYDDSIAEPADAQFDDLSASARRAAVHFGNTTPASNSNAIYVVLSAKGTDPGGYIEDGRTCAYHGFDVDASLGSLPVVNVPYLMEVTNCGAGFVNPGNVLDAYSIAASHEYAETITNTDPGRGWHHSSADKYDGYEIADDCSWVQPGTMGGNGNINTAHGTFAVTSLWSNDAQACLMATNVHGPFGAPLRSQRSQYARLTVDMLKSGTRSAGILVRRK